MLLQSSLEEVRVGEFAVMHYSLVARREFLDKENQESRMLEMTNDYYLAVGCYDTVEAHKKYSPLDKL